MTTSKSWDVLSAFIALVGWFFVAGALLQVNSRFFAYGGIFLIPLCGVLSLLIGFLTNGSNLVKLIASGLVLLTAIAFAISPWRQRAIHDKVLLQQQERSNR